MFAPDIETRGFNVFFVVNRDFEMYFNQFIITNVIKVLKCLKPGFNNSLSDCLFFSSLKYFTHAESHHVRQSEGLNSILIIYSLYAHCFKL